MLRRIITTVSMLALLATTVAAAPSNPVQKRASEKLCALPTESLEAAVAQYPESAAAINVVKNHAIATWYTDRMTRQKNQEIIRNITTHCDKDSRMTLVVYGLPNKDCDAGYSSDGLNKNASDYKQWLQTIVSGVGQRKILYVLEPDAVGLLAKGGCAVKAGYEANVKMALEMLTKNPNADVYLDVGYWTLLSATEASGVAATVRKLANAGRLKGITLNTSNYRPNKQIAELCTNFQTAYGDTSLHCIVDTSRNYNDSPPSSEWCNSRFGGVGRPPTTNTGFANLDYFIWIKPAGESDGTCDGADHTSDSMVGPDAGVFFNDLFVELWNNGYYVKELKYPVITPKVRPTSSPPASSPSPTPSTSSTPKPSKTTPPSTVPSIAPTSQKPITKTPSPTASTSPAPSSPVQGNARAVPADALDEEPIFDVDSTSWSF